MSETSVYDGEKKSTNQTSMYNFLGIFEPKIEVLSILNSESLFSDWKWRHRQTFFRSFKMSTIIPTYSSFDILFLPFWWLFEASLESGSFGSVTGARQRDRKIVF